MAMDVDDPNMQMDLTLDPSLSLNAEGLWSDEESDNSAPSDLDDVPQPVPKRKGGRRKRHEIEPPLQIRDLLAKATSAYGAGDLEYAKMVCEEILNMDDSFGVVYALLSQIHEDLGEKQEAVEALMKACTLHRQDPVIWLRAARLNKELEDYKLALKCFDTTFKLNPEDLDVLYERSKLHAQHGSTKKATDGFMTLLSRIPHDMTITRELASVYIRSNRPFDAIALYDKARQYYMSQSPLSDPNGDLITPFNWDELQFHVDMLVKNTPAGNVIQTIHSTARWLHGRSSEIFWISVTDSREWDEDDTRRAEVKGYIPHQHPPRRYSLPIALRIRLGLSWLQLYNTKEALIQFNFLEKEDVARFAETHLEVGRELHSHKLPSESLKFLTPLESIPTYNTHTTWALLGSCHLTLNNLATAESYLLRATYAHPTDFDSRRRLAQIYDLTNRKEKATETLNAINKDKQIFLPTVPVERKITQRRVERVETAGFDVRAAFGNLERLRPLVQRGARDAVGIWMQLASAVLGEFRKVKSLFPYERGRKILWIEGRKEGEERERSLLGSVVEDEEEDEEDGEERETPRVSREELATRTLRGVEFEKWFDLFMQVRFGSAKIASETMKLIPECNVFYQSEYCAIISNTVALAIAMYQRNFPDVAQHVRTLIQMYQFRSDVYRLYCLALGNGEDTLVQFCHSNDQRFLLRQIKALDACLSGTTIVGAASLQSDTPEIPKAIVTKNNPNLLVLYGHRLAAAGSYAPAQMYYFRARETGLVDPLLELSIGLAYIHRALQRQADNRHIFLLQGFTFLMNYYRLTYQKSESYPPRQAARIQQNAEYNIARAFHHSGLLTYATRYYEKAIEISDELGGLEKDLVFEAVHNLNLIYCLGGNVDATRKLTDKYLVI